MKSLLSKLLIIALLLNFTGIFPALSALAYPAQTVVGGTNLLADGNMEASGTTAWTTAYRVVHTKVSGGCDYGKQASRIAFDGTYTFGFMRKNVVLTTGKTYRVSGCVKGDGLATPVVLVGTGTSDWTGSITTNKQYFDITVVADNDTIAFGASGLSAGRYVEYDNVRVQEFTGSTVLTPVSRSLSFDGVNDVVIGSEVPGVTSSTTAYLEFKSTSSTFLSRQTLLQYSNSSVLANTFNTIQIGTSGRISAAFWNTVSYTGKRSFVITPNTWYKVAYTYDGFTTARLWINGVEQFTTSPENQGDPGAYRIGARAAGTLQPFQGLIDSVNIYSRVLSDSEISGLFNGIFPSSSKKLESLFNSPSGTTAYDTSGNNNHGTITGATISTDTPPNGYAGTPLQTATVGGVSRSAGFDGSSSIIQVNTAQLGTDSTITVYGEFKTTSSTPATYQVLAQLGTSEVPNSRHIISLDSGLLIRAAHYNGSVYSGKRSVTGTILANKWYKFIYTWDGTTPMLYVDGISQPTTTAVAESDYTSSLYIGGRPSNQKFQGNINTTIIWNRVLTFQETLNVLRGIFPKFGMFERFDMDEGSGNTFNDTSGNNNTGTGTNVTFSPDTPQ